MHFLKLQFAISIFYLFRFGFMKLRATKCEFFVELQVKAYHRKNPIEKTRIETTDPIWYLYRAKELDETEAKFSSEEAFGKRLDLHEHYSNFINHKKYRDFRAKKRKEETLV